MKLRDTIQQLRTWGLRGIWNAAMRFPHDFAVARRLASLARKNAATTPTPGITIIAPMGGSYSLSKTMRDFAAWLRDAHIPFQAFDTLRRDSRVANADFVGLLTPPEEFNLLKYTHTVEMLTSPLPPALPLKRCRIAFWEAEHGILNAFPYLADSDAVIAMSDFNAEYFRRALPQRVKVAKIPYPLLQLPDGILDKTTARRKFGLDEDAFVVLYNFDIRARERKNPEGTISAFAKAFADHKECVLLMKVNGASSEALDTLADIAKNCGVAGQVKTVSDYLSQTEIYSLTNACDVYLSLHRAEGFGLGIAEAMQLAKPVIASNYSANTEFCTAETSIPVPCRMVPVEASDFKRHMKYWAQPDTDAAAAALTRLYRDSELRTSLGKNARSFIKRHFSIENFRNAIFALINDNSNSSSMT